jgi:hypothetical protein
MERLESQIIVLCLRAIKPQGFKQDNLNQINPSMSEGKEP